MAVQQVLNTPELLEWLLLSLPERDIVVATRVSRTFKAAIEGSIEIQKKIYLLPDNSKDAVVRFNLMFFDEVALKTRPVPNTWMTTNVWFTDQSFWPPPNDKHGRLASIPVPTNMFTDESTTNDEHPQPRYNYPRRVVWPVHYVWSGNTNEPHQIVKQEEGIRMQDMVEMIRCLGQNFKC